MVVLREMSPTEFQAFLDWSIPRYAEAHVRGGRWKESDSVARSREEHDHLLPQGVGTPDNYLRVVTSETGQRVGELWYALQKQDGWPQVFVYWIGIDEQYRGRGYASDAFRQVEAAAKELGAARVSLHVFADNTTARRLYEKLGYSPTNVIMSKEL